MLVVTSEFCSLCYQPTDSDVGTLLSNGLFGDAIAAAVVRGRVGTGMTLSRNSAYLVPDTEEWISYRVKDTGFHFQLDPTGARDDVHDRSDPEPVRQGAGLGRLRRENATSHLRWRSARRRLQLEGIPILIGVMPRSDAFVERASRMGLGLHPVIHGWKTLEHQLVRFREAALVGGRPGPVVVRLNDPHYQTPWTTAGAGRCAVPWTRSQQTCTALPNSASTTLCGTSPLPTSPTKSNSASGSR